LILAPRDYEINVSEEKREELIIPLVEAALTGDMLVNKELYDQFSQIVCQVKMNRERLADIDMPNNPCKHHTAPFDAIWKMYSYNGLFKYRSWDDKRERWVWDDTPEGLFHNICYLSSRGSGKTLYINKPLNGGNHLTKPDFDATYAGSVIEQANEGWRYFDELMNSSDIIRHKLCKKLTKKESTTKEINSRVGIIVANKRGFNSKHPYTVIIDEFELMEDPSLIEEAVKMVKENRTWGYPNQMIYVSSLKSMSGLMFDMIKNGAKKMFEVLVSCIFDVGERCMPDRMCMSSQAKDCLLLGDCRGILKRKRYSDHYSINNMIFQKINSSIGEWRMQMLSRLIKPVGTVYGREWEEDIHVRRGTYQHNPSWETYGARDFGEGGEEENNNVHLLCQIDPQKNIHWFFELRNNGARGNWTTDRLAREIDKDLNDRYNVIEWFVDKRGTPYITSMYNAGLRINTMKSLQGKYKDRIGNIVEVSDSTLVADGITTVQRKLMTAAGIPSMYFYVEGANGCKALVEDFGQNYKWLKQKVEGIVTYTDKPSKKASHGPDAVRYLISHIFPTLGDADLVLASTMDDHMPQLITTSSGNYLKGTPTEVFGDKFYEKAGFDLGGEDRIMTFEGY